MTTENIPSVSPDDIAFRISSEYHYGFDLLEGEQKRVAEKGFEVIIYNSGAVEVAGNPNQNNESESKTMVIPAGTLPWISKDTEVPVETIEIEGGFIRLFDVSGTDKKLARFGKKLNGSSGRARSLARNSIKEGVVNNGIVESAQVVGMLDGHLPILAAQSGDDNESTRVSAFFTIPESGSNDSFFFAGSRYIDLRKVEDRIDILTHDIKITTPF